MSTWNLVTIGKLAWIWCLLYYTQFKRPSLTRSHNFPLMPYPGPRVNWADNCWWIWWQNWHNWAGFWVIYRVGPGRTSSRNSIRVWYPFSSLCKDHEALPNLGLACLMPPFFAHFLLPNPTMTGGVHLFTTQTPALLGGLCPLHRVLLSSPNALAL